MAKKSAVGVFGLWHLGCVLSAAWSSKKCRVIGFDYDESLIQKLKQSEPPIFEPNLKETLKKNMRQKTLSFTADIAQLKECDYVFLSYDTPVLDNDGSDLTPLERAIDDLGKVLKKGALVIVSSQTPVGTCGDFRETLKSANASLDLVYSPENLRLGEAIHNYLNPGRIILGSEDKTAEKKALELFKLIPAKVLSMNLESAEMVKHGINAFLAMSIAFTNELSDLCEKTGADILDVVKGMKSDPRIGEKAYLSPGIGFSGGTLGRDLKVLESVDASQAKGNFFGEIHARNRTRKHTVISRLKTLLPNGAGAKGQRIGVLGLTYKPGTSTLRRSLPVEIVRELQKVYSQISVFDPKADFSQWSGEKGFTIASSAEKLVKESDAVLILTEWPEFKTLRWSAALRKSCPQIIYDAKNCLIDLSLSKMGYRYVRIGRN
ncbi:MAG: hypothetical protein A2901_06430 [Elusimicrobia bacterium RIFCSPLOWO2_01_FULL_54_10]|nr:MAG: hypothetical protein A2901_06430 [Elusimicrobia bacterium RIFCSPLOWO2_01_FULL_54_10]